MKRTVFTIIWAAMTACCTLHAQHQVQGRVLNADGEAVPEAMVTAVQADDRRVLSSTRTDSAGVFTLPDVPGRFLLDVAAFGYEGYTQEVQAADCEGKTLDVTLAYITLDEATVTATRKPRMVREGNKVVIDHLNNSPHAQGNDMYSFMRYIPVLKVPVLDGNVTVKESGEAPTILLVNGKHINIPMDAYLKNVRVENIESIEVVAYPIGEYKVPQSYSVINLIVKKRPDEGFQYNLYVADTQYGRNSQNGNFSISYTRNKTYITSGIYLNNINTKNETEYNYLYHNTGQQTLESYSGKGHYFIANAYFNLDHELNKRHSIGVQAGVGGNDTDCSDNVTTQYKMQDNDRIDSAYHTRNKTYNPRKYTDMNANLNYTFKVDEKGSTFYADVDYRMQRPKNYVHSLYSPDTGESTDVLQKAQTSADAIGVWLRYIHQFRPGSRLVSGLSYYTAYSRNDYAYGSYEDGNYTGDTDKSNRFEYRDHTFSAYANFEHQPNDKVNFSVGANIQGYKANGKQTVTGEKVNRSDFNVVPNLSVRYMPNDNHYFSLTASYRTDQPGYFSLNPFKIYTSPTTYRTGNPQLKTTKILDAYLSYGLFDDYMFYVSTTYMKNAGNDFIQMDENGQVMMLPMQRDAFDFSASFDYAKSLFDDCLDLDIEIGYSYGKKMSNGGTFTSQKSHEYYIDVDGDITLSEKRRMSLAFNYSFSSKEVGIAYSYPSAHDVSLRFQKRFDNSNFSIGISRTLHRNDTRYFNQTDFSYVFNEKRYWRITASYSITFGNKRTRGVSGRDNSELKSRMSQSQ